MDEALLACETDTHLIQISAALYCKNLKLPAQIKWQNHKRPWMPIFIGEQVEDEFSFDFDNEDFRLSFLQTHKNKCLIPTNEPQTYWFAQPVGYTGTWCGYFDQCIHNNKCHPRGGDASKIISL